MAESWKWKTHTFEPFCNGNWSTAAQNTQSLKSKKTLTTEIPFLKCSSDHPWEQNTKRYSEQTKNHDWNALIVFKRVKGSRSNKSVKILV